MAASSFDDANIPAHIAIVDGRATVERDGRIDSAVENDVVLAGDRFRTERGRLEVMFADGSALDVDQDTDIDLLSDSLMRLRNGQVRLSIRRGAEPPDYRIDTNPASVLIHTAGDYRIALSNLRPAGAELDVAVLQGSAEVQNAAGRTLVRAGTHARTVSESAPSTPVVFNSAVWDAFGRWSEDQRDAHLGLSGSSYLPQDVRDYGGELDRSGSWGYQPAYGNVWYPAVDTGWQPYSVGQWSFAARIGWFWIGVGRWSWPTHHYGRWGVSASRWFWIPDARWSPAWVSWASAPGYVSWCPLGYDGRPVIGIADFSYRPGWTVLPSRSFAPRVLVSGHMVDGRSLPASVRGSLVTRSALPISYDASRGAAPLRGPVASAQRLDSVGAREAGPSRISIARDSRPAAEASDVSRRQIEASRSSSNGALRDDRPRAQVGSARPAPSAEASVLDRDRAIPRTTEQSRMYEARPSAPAPAAEAPAARSRISPLPRRYDARPSGLVTTPEPRAVERSGTGSDSASASADGRRTPTVSARPEFPPAPGVPPVRRPSAAAERSTPPSTRTPEASRPPRSPADSDRAQPSGSGRNTAPAAAPAARDAGPSSFGSRNRPPSSDQGRAVPRGRGGH